jgi:hypothetical protein
MEFFSWKMYSKTVDNRITHASICLLWRRGKCIPKSSHCYICLDDSGMYFPQHHNRQMLAWMVLLSTVLGKTADQSEYVFNDACLTREQYQKPYQENQLHFVSNGYLSRSRNVQLCQISCKQETIALDLSPGRRSRQCGLRW